MGLPWKADVGNFCDRKAELLSSLFANRHRVATEVNTGSRRLNAAKYRPYWRDDCDIVVSSVSVEALLRAS